MAKRQLPCNLRETVREATATAILDAAEHVFSEAGLHAAKMGDIAKHVGIAVGTLYNHFEDRQALLVALWRSRGMELLDRLNIALKQPHATFRADLEAFVSALFAHYAAHAKFLQIVLQGELGATPCPETGHMRVMEDLRERLRKIMARGLAEGILRRDLEHHYVALFLGMMRGIVIQNHKREVPVAPPAVGTVVDLFLHGAVDRSCALPTP